MGGGVECGIQVADQLLGLARNCKCGVSTIRRRSDSRDDQARPGQVFGRRGKGRVGRGGNRLTRGLGGAEGLGVGGVGRAEGLEVATGG